MWERSHFRAEACIKRALTCLFRVGLHVCMECWQDTLRFQCASVICVTRMMLLGLMHALQ